MFQRLKNFMNGVSPVMYGTVVRENVALQNIASHKEKIILKQQELMREKDREIEKWKSLATKNVTMEVCREVLGSRDYHHILNKKKSQMSGDTFVSYLSQTPMLLRSEFLRDTIMEVQFDVMQDIATKTDNIELLLFNRGTINGADLIEERIKTAYSEYVRLTGQEDAKGFERYDPIGKITY